MSNKDNININNNTLSTLIDKVNNLPVANTWGGGTEITPGTSNITIPAYTDTELTVLGDSNLLPENIKEGINIFDIIGTMSEGITPEMFGCTKMSVVEFNTNYETTISVPHQLGEKPRFVYFTIKTLVSYPGYYPVRASCTLYSNSTGTIKTPVILANGYDSTYADVSESEGVMNADSTYAYINPGYGFPMTTYTLITMA